MVERKGGVALAGPGEKIPFPARTHFTVTIK
jgi:hypothetical protein